MNTSWKELINNLPVKVGEKNINNSNVAVCGGDANIARYYFSKNNKKINITPIIDADFIIMTNRASFSKYDKRTCFDAYKGQDLFFVKRENYLSKNPTQTSHF